MLVVSPAGPKGLALLLAIATALPRVRFVCVRTRWTPAAERFALRGVVNVVLADATPDKDALFAVARVLLAPSLWPEAYGIVATEAALRGVPTVSTASGGLSESNFCRELRVDVPLVYDCLRSELRRGTTLEDEEADWAKAAKDWDDVAYVEPSRPPAHWRWRDNPGRRGDGHAYDVGETFLAAARHGVCADGSLVAGLGGLGNARASRRLAPEERAVEARLAAHLDPSFEAAFDGLGVAPVSKLFARATPNEAKPFVDRLTRLLGDAAFYEAMATEAKSAAEAHVSDRAGRVLGLLA